MRKLKTIITGVAVAAGLALTAPAALADGYSGAKGGYKAGPAYAPVSWSTLYFGGGVGYSWTDIDWVFQNVGGGQWSNAAGDVVGFSNDGWIAGGQIGWQHQFGNFVAGVELTLSGGDHQDRITSPFFPATDQFKSDIRWMFGAAVRLGYTWDRWLAYAKVGYATADVVIRGETTAGGFADESSSERHKGWLIGVGFEYMFRDHVSIGLDYTYMDLGSETHTLFNPANGLPPTRVDVDLDGVHTLMARINFHLHRGGHPEAKPLK